MKLSLIRVALLLGAVPALAPAAAPATPSLPAPEQRVGEWSDLARLEFTGLQTYTAEQIRQALGKHVPFLNAAHPLAPRQGLLPALQEHIRAGYLANGFPDVQVQSRLDPAARRIRVAVTEGRRYRCGDLRVQGATSVPLRELTRRLTERWPPVEAAVIQPNGFNPHTTYLDSAGQEVQPVDPIWVRDSIANFSAPHLKALKQRVAQVLADCGYFFAQVEVRPVPQTGSGRAELQIKITNEGPHQQLGRIEVHGLKRHSPEKVIRWLGLAPGQPIQPDLVARIEQQLWDSARFTAYRVVPASAPDAQQRLQLDLWLTEAEKGPLVDEDFSPVERAMLRFRDWLQAQISFSTGTTDDIVVTVPAVPGLPADFGALELILARQGLLAVHRRDSALCTALLLTADQRLFFSASQSCKLASNRPGARLNIFATVQPNPSDDQHPNNMTFGAGLTSATDAAPGSTPFRIDVLLAPVSFLWQAHAATPATELSGDRLIISNDAFSLEIDAATGRILNLQRKKSDSAHFPRLRFERGAFARVAAEVQAASAAAPNRFSPEQAASSLLRVLGTEVLAAPYLAKILPDTATPAQRAAAAAAFDKLCARAPLAALDRWWDSEAAGEEFSIPVEPANGTSGDNSLASLLTVLIQSADAFLPPQSWPWKLLREMAFAGTGNAPYLAATAEEIASSTESGPLAFWGAATVLGLVDKPSAGILARRGLERLTAADFQRDCRLFFEEQSGLSAAVQALAVGLRDLSPEEIDALVVLIPAELGNELRRAREALRARPGEPLAAVLQPLLEEVWEKHLRARVEAALREVAGTAANAAEAERLFQEGARHFNTPPGPTTDFAAGARSLRQAAELGHPKAEFLYAQLLTNGTGVARDTAAALEWHRRAANHGIIESQMAVGTAYHLGLDVAADPAEAFFWFSVAAAGGHKPAESLRNVTQRKLSPEQITAAEARLKALLNPQPAVPPDAPPAAKKPIPEAPRPDSPDEPRVHLRLIQLTRPAGTSDATLLEQAKAILARLQQGERFADLAQEFSNDLKRSKGGDWGWLKRSDFKAEFADIAFSLPKGGVSKPILQPEGCFLLYIEDRR